MGGKIVLPEMDDNVNKVVKNFMFTPTDISDFWKIFSKMDKAKTGLVPLVDIFKRVEMERNLITDCLLELLEIEHDGEINFSDFLYMVSAYCFFEVREILKFCFYVFDQDKTGFFSVDDLNNLVNAIHNITGGGTVKGTVKASWMKLSFTGTELEFPEFKAIHNQFPRLFEPAFRLQQQLRINFKGEGWWQMKRDRLDLAKELVEAKEQAVVRKKEKKKALKKSRKTKRAMGALRYYLMPCMRKYYDPTVTAYDRLTDEEKALRDKEVFLARRQAELRVKNPETAAWQNYQDKVKASQVAIEEDEEEPASLAAAVAAGAAAAATAAADGAVTGAAPVVMVAGVVIKPEPQYIEKAPGKKVVSNAYLDQKIATTEKVRATRSLSREERKQQRLGDPDLRQRQRTTVSGAEY